MPRDDQAEALLCSLTSGDLPIFMDADEVVQTMTDRKTLVNLSKAERQVSEDGRRQSVPPSPRKA
jgi:hypothetical protein